MVKIKKKLTIFKLQIIKWVERLATFGWSYVDTHFDGRCCIDDLFHFSAVLGCCNVFMLIWMEFLHCVLCTKFKHEENRFKLQSYRGKILANSRNSPNIQVIIQKCGTDLYSLCIKTLTKKMFTPKCSFALPKFCLPFYF